MPPPERPSPTRRRLDRLAWLLDSSIPLPVGNRSIGLDALIGLLPGVGDTLGTLLSSYILVEAARLGAPVTMLVKMGFNVVLESIVGTIPLLGDLFDAGWKANERNVRLLEAYLDDPEDKAREGRLLTYSLAAVLVLLVLAVTLLGVYLVYALWQLLA